MYRNILLLICGLLGSVSLLHAQKLVKAGMGYSSTSVNKMCIRDSGNTYRVNSLFGSLLSAGLWADGYERQSESG